MPKGESLGVVSRVVTDSQDRVYVFQRKDPPVVVFDPDGNYLGSWGAGAVKEAHGMKIVDDVVYTTDRPDSVAVSVTLDGRPLLVLGKRGVHSDTGCARRATPTTNITWRTASRSIRPASSMSPIAPTGA